jgi:glycine dehydrogenase subunit 2
MIEPTETESLETLDRFIEVMRSIALEAKESPDMLKNAPFNTPVRHPDDTEAALHPKVTYDEL